MSPSSAAPMEVAPQQRLAPVEKAEITPQPGAKSEKKRVFTAVKGKIESQMPVENADPLQKAVMDVLDYATEWPPGTEFEGGSITTKVGSNPNAPSQVRYDIKRINDDGDFVGVGFQGTEVVLKRADLVAETVDEKFRLPDGSINEQALADTIPDESSRKYLVALLSAQKRGQAQLGEVADQSVVVEAARSMGFLMRKDVLSLATKAVNPETGKPYITEAEFIQITDPPTETDKQIPLSATATELVGKLGNEEIIDHEHATDALFSLGVVTNSGQMERKAHSMLQRRDLLKKTKDQAMSGEDLATFTARQTREEAEFKTINEQLEAIEKLQMDTKGAEWDVLKGYEGLVIGGEGTEGKKDELLNDISDPKKSLTEDQLRDLDSSYNDWMNEANVKDKAKKQKAFFRKLLMGGGIGFGGLFALQVWRAGKKDEK